VYSSYSNSFLALKYFLQLSGLGRDTLPLTEIDPIPILQNQDSLYRPIFNTGQPKQELESFNFILIFIRIVEGRPNGLHIHL